uniref:Uncharacterized protein n=1 Tax=Arundo donax TaxID=35708 RepID=A0A0A9HAQ1_ARUDO
MHLKRRTASPIPPSYAQIVADIFYQVPYQKARDR